MVGRFPCGAFNLLVALVTDQQDVVVLAGKTPRFVVHLGNQGAGGVNGLQPARLSLGVDRRRHPVRGEDDRFAFGDFVKFLHEHRAA